MSYNIPAVLLIITQSCLYREFWGTQAIALRMQFDIIINRTTILHTLLNNYLKISSNVCWFVGVKWFGGKSVMLASHCPEIDTRWTHGKGNVQIRLWSENHRAIRESILRHRMTAGGVSQAPATTSWAVAKSLACQKIAEGPCEGTFSCVHFALRKAIARASSQIVSSSSLLRVIIGAIGHFSPHEDNTKETRSCPIVLGRQHGYVKPSQCRRVPIVL